MVMQKLFYCSQYDKDVQEKTASRKRQSKPRKERFVES